MAFEGSPAVARHRLRLALRTAREAKDLTQGQVAEALDWSLSKLQRIEGGENSISPTDTRALLQVLSVTEHATVEELVAQAKGGRRRSMWEDPAYRDHLTGPMKALFQFESHAKTIRTFQTALIPGPLQTPAFAREIFDYLQRELSAEDREVRAKVRAVRRRNIFERPDPPDYYLTLDALFLERMFGGGAVFADQLNQLLDDVRAERVRLRLIPHDREPFHAMINPFTVLTLDDDEDAVLYRENLLVDEIGQLPERVHRHLEMFDHFWHLGFSEEESRQLVEDRLRLLLGSDGEQNNRS